MLRATYCTQLRVILCLAAGGSEGIGRETALELARRGASIIIASRRPAIGQAAVNYIIGVTPLITLL